MKTKLIKIALIGRTNAGKSTLINCFVGEKISIVNKKINTTQDLIKGIVNIKNTQIIFFDSPGSNFLKTKNDIQKKLKKIIWEVIESVDYILYIVDVKKYDFSLICKDLKKISEAQKKIIFIFNKIDLIDKNIILPYIRDLDKINLIEDFFNISAKKNLGIDKLLSFLKLKAKENNWLFSKDDISSKDEIFITNECTRDAILYFVHKEIPYNLNIKNLLFKKLKNGDIKIKQSINLKNLRYKSILLGKDGKMIKKIREKSQRDISNIVKTNVHLYLKINKIDD